MLDQQIINPDRSPLRVLHLITWLGRGGAEMWLMSMLREIPRDVCAMDICCKGAHVGEMAPEAEQLGAKVFHCPLDVTHVGFGRSLTGVLRAGGYDIVHNHLNVYSGFPVWISHRVGIPVITTFHATRFDPEDIRLKKAGLRQLRMIYEFGSIRYAVRKSDMVTGVSRAVLDKFVHKRNQGADKSDVLYLGVKIPQLSTEEERSGFRNSMGWSAETPLILHVGSFTERKNHKGVVAVFERVVEALPEARLLLVGAGDLRPNIESEVKRRHIADAVRFLGLRDDVPKLMTMCDVLLFPSLYEGLPLVPLEANAAGIPVVGSKIPEIEEAFQLGVTGMLHELDDLPGMADSVVKLLMDRSLARKLGQAGRNRVQQEFSATAAANRLVSLYTRVINGVRSRAQPFTTC
jgi:glycosyltransferase EpsF